MSDATWAELTAIKLRAPFPPSEILWKINARTQDKAKGLVSPYVDARAVQRRLDAIFGWDGWKADYKPILGDGTYAFICRLSVLLEDGDWLPKEDGADVTLIESTKGGISTALRRAAAAGLGIGRYLYNVPGQWVRLGGDGKKIEEQPVLPTWALPEGTTDPAPQTAVPLDPDETPSKEPGPLLGNDGVPLCPKCGGKMKDDRQARRDDMRKGVHARPAFMCENSDCGGFIESVARWCEDHGFDMDADTGDIVPRQADIDAAREPGEDG